MKRKELSLEDYLTGIKKKDMSVLARAITLVESRNLDHQKLAGELIKEVLKLIRAGTDPVIIEKVIEKSAERQRHFDLDWSDLFGAD